MKNSKISASRWIREAEHTLKAAEDNLKSGRAYNFACFLAEQTAQQALKAVLYFEGSRFITIHSISELIKQISKKRTEFLKYLEQGSQLDQYYLSSRYPDAVAEPAIPSEIFNKDQAEKAVAIAKEIFKASRAAIGN